MTPLPNPYRELDPCWQIFSNYIKSNGIVEVNHSALDAYQNSDVGEFLSADKVNHFLNLRYFGVDSGYAACSREVYDESEDDLSPQSSIDELDNIFIKNSYIFSDESVVFKGIGLKPFYKVLGLHRCSVGDVVTFPGFLSTSVCREVAEKFSGQSCKIILEIVGLDRINAIVPLNKCVLFSSSSDIPEQEILLGRGLAFVVTAVFIDSKGFFTIRLNFASGSHLG